MVPTDPIQTVPSAPSAQTQTTAEPVQVVPQQAPANPSSQVVPQGQVTQNSFLQQELEQVKAQNAKLTNENAQRRVAMNDLQALLAAKVGMDAWDTDAYISRVDNIQGENVRLQQERLVAEVATESGLDGGLLLTVLKGENKLPSFFNEATKVELQNTVSDLLIRYPTIKPQPAVGGVPAQPANSDLYTLAELNALSPEDHRTNQAKVTESLRALGYN